ncbi:lipopolysaccharide biosynthesis protein [Williamsia herbipolensis]|uniref:lipopolysaccharide biosynthesis protein n=1 Tax=Williamsia herbipolensis TaxID=1603258 RepID=UPI0005F85999|nr:hypothetical protein [Williamsia herbipolensis]
MTRDAPDPVELLPGATSSGAVNRAIVAGFGGKIAMTVLNLLVVAIAARSLGTAGFGVVAILTGLVTTLGFLDLGIGNSTISTISSSLSAGDLSRARRDIGIAVVTTAAIGAVVAVAGTLVALAVPRALLFETPGITDLDLRLSIVVFALALGIAIPGTLGSRICLARERGAVNNWYLVAGAAAGVAATGICALLNASLWLFVVATVLVPTIALAVQTGVYLSVAAGAISPLWDAVSWKAVRAVGHSSFYFMVLGACSAVSFQTNTLVVAYVLDSRAAGILGIATRAYSLVSTLFVGGLQQSWASSARAMAQGNITWVRVNFWRVFRVTGIPVLVISAVLVVIGRPVIELWAGGDSIPPLALLVALAAWTCYSFVMTQISFLLNAADVLRPQAILSAVLLIATIPLSVYMTRHLGLEGSTLAMLLAHLCIAGFPFVVMGRNVLRRPDGIPQRNSWSAT